MSVSGLIIKAVSAAHPDAVAIRAKLSKILETIVGDPGHNSFADWQDDDPGHVFVVAYIENRPVGCGGLRPLGPAIGEIKRMYAEGGGGIGSAILTHLETIARHHKFKHLRLETRRVNLRAIKFYEAHGYKACVPYGRYVGRADARCFEKQL